MNKRHRTAFFVTCTLLKRTIQWQTAIKTPGRATKAARSRVGARAAKTLIVTVRADRSPAEAKVARTPIAVAKAVRAIKNLVAVRAVKSPAAEDKAVNANYSPRN
jgi:hypothetical protein